MTLIGIVSFLVLAVVISVVVKSLMPGRDPGIGPTILLGTAAQVVAWIVLRLLGWDRFGQPWAFFLSIAAGCLLLHVYRESGLDDVQQRRVAVAAAEVARENAADCAPMPQQSLPLQVGLATTWALVGALLLGITGFFTGFFGPMRFQPGSNQGPMLGIFITGPLGVLVGAFLGAALKLTRPHWAWRRLLWTLNAANVTYAAVIVDLLADPWWQH